MIIIPNSWNSLACQASSAVSGRMQDFICKGEVCCYDLLTFYYYCCIYILWFVIKGSNRATTPVFLSFHCLLLSTLITFYRDVVNKTQFPVSPVSTPSILCCCACCANPSYQRGFRISPLPSICGSKDAL